MATSLGTLAEAAWLYRGPRRRRACRRSLYASADALTSDVVPAGYNDGCGANATFDGGKEKKMVRAAL
jgi:hypothetical protein